MRRRLLLRERQGQSGGVLERATFVGSRVPQLTALKVRFFGLQPCHCPATHVTGADALPDDSSEVHPARMGKDGSTIAGHCLAKLGAVAQRLLLRNSSFAKRLPALFQSL